MKHTFLSRRHRNPHQHDEQQKEQPFFSKSNDTESEPFFSAAGHGQPVQAKFEIGQPGDKYEKEADAVANHVVNGQTQTPTQPKGVGVIQRLDLATPVEDEKLSTAEARMEKDKRIQEKPEKEEEKPVQMQAGSTMPPEKKEEKPVQMQTGSTMAPEKKEEKPVQMQTASANATPDKEEKLQAMSNPLSPKIQRETETGGSTASPPLSSRLQDSSGKGKTLPGKTRAEMESAMGTDFGGVNIHTDASAVEMSEELGAQAFTHGQDVYFNSGKYHPESADGKKLLAHELTHVVQQRGDDQVSLDRAKAASQSAGVGKNMPESSFIFDGNTKVRDALITIGDFETAARQGAYSLAELVIKLNDKKFPKTGALIGGDRYNFQIVSADAKGLTIPRIKIIRKQQ